ncbi:MAG: NfeD family protein [Anaerobacillus sp.]|uniref:NfeD family protein n=1 Tax=Anaerobacillus sp. TaxID=1872506 RepID=UPI0039193F71
MELFGYSLETIYLITLIVSGSLTLLYILFGDLVEGLFDGLSEGPVNPTVILAFLTIFSAMAYLMEKLTAVHSFIIIIFSLITALILVTMLNVFILIPLSKAEATLAYSDEDLKGRVGKVITSIPIDGFGEVIIQGYGGTIAKSAVSFEEEAIPYDTDVLVIEVKNGVLHVVPHEKFN